MPGEGGDFVKYFKTITTFLVIVANNVFKRT